MTPRATVGPSTPIGSIKLSDLRQQFAFVALIALVYMSFVGLHPFTERVGAAAADKGGGDVINQLWYTTVFVVALMTGQPTRHPRSLLVLPLPLAIALGWCLLSIAWSIVPGIALRRLLLTAMIVFAIFRLIDQLGGDRSVTALRVVLCGILLLNYFAIAVSPVAIHHTTEIAETNLVGAWRGAMAHKNFAGPACAATVIIFLFHGRGLAWGVRAAVIVAGAYFLFRTQSKTSMGLLGASIACGGLYLLYRPRYRMLLIPALLLLGTALGYIATAYWDVLTAPLNDQTAFTGRVQIWPAMIAFISDHSLLGTGFGSFWNIGPVNPISQYAKGWVAELGNGHNGYLDLAAQIGLPGLALAVFATIVFPIGRLLVAKDVHRALGGMALALIVFCAGNNLTETSLFDRDAIAQVLAMVGLALAMQAARPRAPAAPRLPVEGSASR